MPQQIRGACETGAGTFGSAEHAPLHDAIIGSTGEPVKPQSLYVAQLKARLGEQAVKNIGY